MNVLTDLDLQPLHTMGLRARARHAVRLESLEDVRDAYREAQRLGVPLRVVGGGSNLLPHEQVEGLVALMAMKGRRDDGVRGDSHYVTVQAGETWDEVVAWSVSLGLGGLENLSAIPGTAGAAPIQNIGAYGLELAERFGSLKAYDTERDEVVEFDKAACGFAYRDSVFKHQPERYVVLEVTLALPQAWRPLLNYAGLDDLPETCTPREVRARVSTVRAAKLPDWRTLGNAGSFFHNPIVAPDVAERIEGGPRYPQADGRVKLSAAWLIEACGLKGYRDGPVGIYDTHALVMVNHGGATFADIDRVTRHVQAQVQARFGVELVREPQEI